MSGKNSTCENLVAKIDYGGCDARLVLSGRREPRFITREQRRERGTRVRAPTRVQEAWRERLIPFFLGINSRRTNISLSVILRVTGKRRRRRRAAAANGV